MRAAEHAADHQGVERHHLSFAGGMGLAPEWELNGCGVGCQELVRACMMAHVNTKGRRIGLWMVGPTPALGWGYTSDYPYQEGLFSATSS